MLKRIVRHRLFQIFFCLVLVIASLATPIRHDYTTNEAPITGEGSLGCGLPCSGQVTEVQYGVPFVWMKLDKQSDEITHKQLTSSKTIIASKMLLDLASYAGLILLLFGILKLDDKVMHANFRN